MFEIGFSELIVIAIVALVVIGPERLPKVARTAGHLLGRLQRYVNDLKADINHEIQLEELKTLQASIQESARNLKQDIASEMQTVKRSIDQTTKSAVEESTLPATGGGSVRELPDANPETADMSANPAGKMDTA
jgi:sec-independent protein translocase protein TatB